MAKNSLDTLIDAIGDAIGSSHYLEDLKIAQKYTGLTYDRENYERYKDKGVLRVYYRPEIIHSNTVGRTERMAAISMSFVIVNFLMRRGLIFTDEMIDSIPDDMKRDNYTEQDLRIMRKVAELHRRGVPLPSPENWQTLFDL